MNPDQLLCELIRPERWVCYLDFMLIIAFLACIIYLGIRDAKKIDA